MTSFLNACGITDSLKLLVEGPETAQSEIRLLQQPFAIIGRNFRADVVLDHLQVSRRHVYLQVIEGRAFWIDLGSRTGTQAGKRSQKLGWLDGRRTLSIGPYEIRLSIDTSQNDDSSRSFLPRDAPFLVRAYSQAPLPEATLEFLNGPSRSTRWPVHRVMSLLGSASGCKLRLADPSVSRFHASLVRTPGGLWVVDLLAQSGITVNSVPVRFSRLEDGDVLEIGRYQIRVQCGSRGQDAGNRSPGSMPLSILRPENRGPNGLELPDWAATAAAMGFTPGSGSSKGAEPPVLARPPFPSCNVEIMPSDGAYPVKATQSDSTESLLVPLVNQFGLMQQQMFDQFQQSMGMLVQMFGQMHRDQMQVIRAELDSLRELTAEFQSLKEELAKRTPAQSQPAAPSPLPIPASARGERLSEKADPSATSGRPLSGRTVPSPPSEQPQSTGSRAQLGPGNSDATADKDKDTILWLHQRITSIQSERESRWQKILKLLPGVS
jgi:pSer/pThr/pTyr-binding forkhead associated (FHA) protein